MDTLVLARGIAEILFQALTRGIPEFGVKSTCCAWAGGTFFPVVLLCQFFGF
jgi:hypothetical protein